VGWGGGGESQESVLYRATRARFTTACMSGISPIAGIYHAPPPPHRLVTYFRTVGPLVRKQFWHGEIDSATLTHARHKRHRMNMQDAPESCWMNSLTVHTEKQSQNKCRLGL